MIQKIKEDLINSPDKLVEVLTIFDFAKFRMHKTYISLARDNNSESSAKSITVKLENNPNCVIVDRAKGIYGDIFSFVIKEKGVEFRDIFAVCKEVLGIEDGYYDSSSSRKTVFGGLFDSVKKKRTYENEIISEETLNNYDKCPNKRFLRDHISLKTQVKFGIGYDTRSNSITIPIRNPYGDLIGVKARKNEDECEMKYYYDIPCNSSYTLFGYSENYSSLYEADEVYIMESEKGVMQAYSYGYRNVVALACSSLSSIQTNLLLSLRAKRYVFLFDKGLKRDAADKSINMLKVCGRMFDFEIYEWDSENSDFEDKDSPTDRGKEKFEDVLLMELKEVE